MDNFYEVTPAYETCSLYGSWDKDTSQGYLVRKRVPYVGIEDLSARLSFKPCTILDWQKTNLFDLMPITFGRNILYPLPHVYSLFGMYEMKDRLLDRKMTSAEIRFSHGTLAVWACKGPVKLDFIKINRSVRYRLSDIRKFKAQLLL